MGLLSLSASRRSFPGTTISTKKAGHCLRSGRQSGVLDQGFTLMEAMITVAIVGILAAIAYPSFTGHINNQANRNTQQSLIIAAQDCAESVIFGETYSVPSNVDGECDVDGGELSMTSSKSGDTSTISIDGEGILAKSF